MKNLDGDTVPCDDELRERWSTKKPYELRRVYGECFRYCKRHKKVERVGSKCFMREVSDVEFPNVRTFSPYWDEHIGRRTHGGQPVFVRSQRQRRHLLKANELTETG